jgi:hypothetical protein
MLLWSSTQTINQLGGRSKETPSQKENSCHQVECQGSFQTMPPQRIDGSANLHSTSRPLPGSDDAQALFWQRTLPLRMECNFRISLQLNKCNLATQQLGPTHHPFCHSCPSPRTTQGSSVRQRSLRNIPVNARGIVDVYIDNFIGLTVDLDDSNNATRLERSPLLGLTAIFREVSPFEPLPRDNMDA